MRRHAPFIFALTLLALIASAGVANFMQLRDLRSFVRPSLTEPIALEVYDMSKITRTKVVNEETIELVCCQEKEEDFGDFIRRCNAEWKALCDSLEE
jgi:hypothetical protein